MDSGKLSRRMRAALVKEIQAEGVDEEQKDGEEECRVEQVMQQVESMAKELIGIRDELSGQAERIGALEGRMSEPSTSPGTRSEVKSDVEEGAPKVAGSPGPGPELPTLVVALEPQPHVQEAFGAAALLVTEWRCLRAGVGVGTARVERARAAERRWALEIEMIEEFGLTLPPETGPLNKSRRDTHLGWRKEALNRARRERIRAQRLRCLRRVLTFGLWWH